MLEYDPEAYEMGYLVPLVVEEPEPEPASRAKESALPEPEKYYRRHYCTRKHRDYFTVVKCLWKRAYWITGPGGPYALLAPCRVLTITLWPDMEEANKSKLAIDLFGCGGHCGGRSAHEIIKIAPLEELVSDPS